MTYSKGHPVRMIGGRLVLDFVNTADWSSDNHVVHEKIMDLADLKCWLGAQGLEAVNCDGDISELLNLRVELRQLLLGSGNPDVLNELGNFHIPAACVPDRIISTLPLNVLLISSALSILADNREMSRLSMCNGDSCGWLFIDESRNSRRKWCSMDSCGNRAKAARHYARRKQEHP